MVKGHSLGIPPLHAIGFSTVQIPVALRLTDAKGPKLDKFSLPQWPSVLDSLILGREMFRPCG